MSHPTLLQMTQGILARMESDTVSAIASTQEATDVANLIGDIYKQIIDEFDLEEIKTTKQLSSGTAGSAPTSMAVPDGIFGIELINYDVRTAASGIDKAWKEMKHMEPKDFLDQANGLSSELSTIDTITTSGIEVLVNNDAFPTYWTSFDGGGVVFLDAYKSSLESALVASKTQVYASEHEALTIADATIIDLPVHLFSLLRWEATELAMDLWAGGAPRKVRRLATRSRVRSQRTGHRTRINREQINRVDYGRPDPS